MAEPNPARDSLEPENDDDSAPFVEIIEIIPAEQLVDEIAGCDVDFDDRPGCGLKVSRRVADDQVFVGLTFINRRADRTSHDLSLRPPEVGEPHVD